MLHLFRQHLCSVELPDTIKTCLSYAILASFTLLPAYASAQAVDLENTADLHLHKVEVTTTTYQGRKALRVTEAKEFLDDGPDKLVIIEGIEFQNGVIEVEVAGLPLPGANPGARGFIGVAFHVNADVSRYECIYLRPTNGRADDQVRRNHASQYVSFPDYPWSKLREETPGKYEAYVDLQAGEWTKMRVEVSGTSARLFVHGAEQPTLIVNDLKLGETSGAVALRIGPGTEGYFSNLQISKNK
jgi:hypothetical protein